MYLQKALKKLLISVDVLLGVLALIAGYLISTEMLALDRTFLSETPFTSYEIPGLTLMLGVAPLMLLAGVLLWRQLAVGELVAEFAGMFLIAAIVLQLLVIKYATWGHGFVIVLGLGMTVVAAELYDFRKEG